MPRAGECRASKMTENQPKFTTHASAAMATPTHVHNAKSAVNCDISKVNTHTTRTLYTCRASIKVFIVFWVCQN